MKKPAMLLMVALWAPTGGARPEAIEAQAARGVIEGRVTLEPPPPRRSANRYPGGPTATHEIQRLPAFVYLVGPIPGGGDSDAQPTMAQRDTTFVPSVVAVRAGGSVRFPNGDPFFHNVFSYSNTQRFDLGRYPEGESKTVTFPDAGIVEIFCEVHEFMRGAIVVTENPFHSVVGADGTFRITGVPEGTHTVAFWHPDHRPLERRVTVGPDGPARIEVELGR